MLENSSAPPGPIVPSLVYDDVNQAIAWLAGAFGFRERLRTPPEPDGSTHHAQIAVGEGAIILTTRAAESPRPESAALLVPVADADSHCERARAFGARIVRPPNTCEFGERQYTAEDPGGYQWTFSQSVRDVNPPEWGAQVAELSHRVARLPRPRWCYFEIPALDPARSADFYEHVFGWNIRGRGTARPSFDDATGNVSGAWVTGRPPAAQPGLLPYIWVDRMVETLARVRERGGEPLDSPHPDSPGSSSAIARFRDPAGNVIGLYQEGAGR